MAENKKLYINTDEKHEPTDVIYSNLYASDELKAATLRKMKEIKRENERRQALKSRIVRRAMLTAAIVALVIAVTPLRGYVASAAESAYEAFHSWMEDVFRVGMKKTDNGCTVEIIEANLGNDFIYVSIDENFEELYSKTDDTIGVYNEYDNGSCYANVYVPYYYGTISDNEGNSAAFVSGNEYFEEYFDKASADNSLKETKQYAFYSPDLRNVINSSDKKYTCELHLRMYLLPTYSFEHFYENIYFHEMIALDEDEKYNGIAPSVSMDFNFSIENFNYVLNADEYEHVIEQSINYNDIDFRFIKLFNLKMHSDNMLVEIKPLKGQSLNKSLVYLDIQIENALNDNEYFEHSYVLQNVYYIDSKYYAVLSSKNNNENLAELYKFHVTNIDFWLCDDSYSGANIDVNFISIFDAGAHSYKSDNVYKELKSSALTLKSSGEFNDFGYLQSIDIGDFMISFGSFSEGYSYYENGDVDMDTIYKQLNVRLEPKFFTQNADPKETILNDIDDFTIEMAIKRDGKKSGTIWVSGGAFCFYQYSDSDKKKLDSKSYAIYKFSNLDVSLDIPGVEDYSTSLNEIFSDLQPDEFEIMSLTYHWRISDNIEDEYDEGTHKNFFFINPEYYNIEEVKKTIEGKTSFNNNNEFTVNFE